MLAAGRHGDAPGVRSHERHRGPPGRNLGTRIRKRQSDEADAGRHECKIGGRPEVVAIPRGHRRGAGRPRLRNRERHRAMRDHLPEAIAPVKERR